MTRVSGAQKVLKHLEEGKDKWVLYILALCGCIALWYFGHEVAAVACVSIAAFDFSVLFLWALMACFILASLTCIFLAMLSIVPSQFFPDTYSKKAQSSSSLFKAVKYRIAGTAVVLTVFFWAYLFKEPMSYGGVALFVFLFLFFFAITFIGTQLRGWIRDIVVEKLLLPGISILDSEVLVMNGRRVPARAALLEIRKQMMWKKESSSSLPPSSPDVPQAPSWVNVTVLERDGVSIDAAYFENPHDTTENPSERRWAMWLLGNAQLYEFSFNELRQFALDSGMSVFVFNYRRVGFSMGKIVQAGDLVEDGIACLQYMEDRLGADANNILVIGHSIGGSVGTIARACHSPTGPIVCDRSFSSLPAAATGILSTIFATLVKKKVALPQWLVGGLLSSVFKGRLDTLSALKKITGRKVVLYHEDDKIIPYDISSLHKAMVNLKERVHAESIRLSPVSAAADSHNHPLDRFPEYHHFLQTCRACVGLDGNLPNIQGNQVIAQQKFAL